MAIKCSGVSAEKFLALILRFKFSKIFAISRFPASQAECCSVRPLILVWFSRLNPIFWQVLKQAWQFSEIEAWTRLFPAQSLMKLAMYRIRFFWLLRNSWDWSFHFLQSICNLVLPSSFETPKFPPTNWMRQTRPNCPFLMNLNKGCSIQIIKFARFCDSGHSLKMKSLNFSPILFQIYRMKSSCLCLKAALTFSWQSYFLLILIILSTMVAKLERMANVKRASSWAKLIIASAKNIYSSLSRIPSKTLNKLFFFSFQ